MKVGEGRKTTAGRCDINLLPIIIMPLFESVFGFLSVLFRWVHIDFLSSFYTFGACASTARYCERDGSRDKREGGGLGTFRYVNTHINIMHTGTIGFKIINM